MDEERIKQVASVIFDKWTNGEGSQVGDAEDHGLTEDEMDQALVLARQEWEGYVKGPVR